MSIASPWRSTSWVPSFITAIEAYPQMRRCSSSDFAIAASSTSAKRSVSISFPTEPDAILIARPSQNDWLFPSPKHLERLELAICTQARFCFGLRPLIWLSTSETVHGILIYPSHKKSPQRQGRNLVAWGLELPDVPTNLSHLSRSLVCASRAPSVPAAVWTAAPQSCVSAPARPERPPGRYADCGRPWQIPASGHRTAHAAEARRGGQ